jgi:hypothetical protein
MRKMQGALSGLRDSLVKSQVWRPDIAHALQTYPILEMRVLEIHLDGCEACHLVDRVSSHKAILSGEPYDNLGYKVREGPSSTYLHWYPSTAAIDGGIWTGREQWRR